MPGLISAGAPAGDTTANTCGALWWVPAPDQDVKSQGCGLRGALPCLSIHIARRSTIITPLQRHNQPYRFQIIAFPQKPAGINPSENILALIVSL